MDNGTETINVSVAAPVVQVAVAAQNTAATVPPGTPQTASFTVQNTGTDATTYSLIATCGGSITCGAQPDPLMLQRGGQITVSVGYQSGSAGTTGTVTLAAQAGSANGSATSNISSDHVYGVTVSPKNQGVGVSLNSQQTYSFNVHNGSDLQQTYTLAVSCTGATVDPNSCGVPSPLTMNGNSDATVVVSYTTTSSAGLATVSLTATSASNGSISDLANLTVHSPADGSIVVPSNSTNNAMSVTAYNGEYTPITWYPGCSNITGPITRCVGSPTSISIPGRQSRNGEIYFDVGTGPATASFDPNVLDSNVPTTQVTIAAPDFRVSVTPDQATATLPHDALQYLAFTVKNIGSNPATYNTTGSCGPALSCTSSQQQVSLSPGASTSVGMAFYTGAPGTTGTARLTATSIEGSFTNAGTSTVTSEHVYGVTVMPIGGSTVTLGVGAAKTTTFNVHNESDLSLPYTLTLDCAAAPVTGCSITSPTSPVTLPGYGDATVTVQLTGAGSPASGPITLGASSGSASSTASLTVNVTVGGGGGGGVSTGSLRDVYGRGLPTVFMSGVAADRCMDISGASRTSGARVTVWNCLTSPSYPAPQQHFAWMATGELKVYAGTPDEKCLDVAGGDVTGNGTPVIIWYCNGIQGQKWIPGPNGDDLRVAGTTKCLAVDGRNTAPGTGLIIWDCSGNSDQKWTHGPLPNNAGSLGALYGTATASEILSGITLDRCMDIGGASRDAGARVTIWHCLTSAVDWAPQQHFSWMPTKELKAYAGTPDEKCLDVAGGDVTGNGTPVIIWYCNGIQGQKWIPGPNGDDLRVAGTTKCLAVDGGNTAPGTGLIIWDCSGNSDQKWTPRGSGSTPGASPIDLSQANFGETVTRDRCLTISLGRGAAYECGDLRLIHALPTTRTMNKERTPVLLYNSQHASPHPIINADITLPSGITVPTTVQAKLTLAGSQMPSATASWNGSDWSAAGNKRRVALSFDASGLATGTYPYTLTVTTQSGLTTTGSVAATGTVIVVNRSASPFGPGWWLAGLEQLIALPDGGKLWVGGDGSARVYHPASTPNIWVADMVDRPDSVTFDGLNYTRWDEHRLRVVFDASGNHAQTVNRLQQVTTFGYSGSLLQTIAVPTPSGSLSYTFGYVAGMLTSVSSPDGRSVNIGRSGSTIAITDPDNTTVQFAYGQGTNRISSRTDRRGDQVSYSYDTVGTVNHVQVAMGSAPAINTSIRAAESQATGATAIAADSVYTLINGPRMDTTVTRVWIDRFGEPTKIADAIGGVTSLVRGDARFPALVTQTTDPTGFVTRATYDGHGNDSTVTRVNPLGDGQDATAMYTWDGTFDFVASITQPLGEKVTMGYDPATGNRTFEYPGSDPIRQVQYFYEASGQLAAWQIPGNTARDTVAYDALGNVSFTRTPLGHQTTHYPDAAGRDTMIVSPLDTLDRRHVLWWAKLDGMGRDTLSVSYSDSLDTSSSDSLITRKHFDAEGNVDSVSTLSRPNRTPRIGWVRHTMTYDNLNRQMSEVMVDSAGYPIVKKLFTYDAAGNRTNGGRGGGNTMTVQFDALNRQIARIGDSDVARYTYDGASRLLTADNRYAQVGRSYYPGGALKADTLRIAVADTAVPVAARFSAHVYPDSISYDLDGRRRSLLYPDGTLVSYSYDPVFGKIEQITGPGGDLFTTQYDLASRLSQRTRLVGTVDNSSESWSYDADSRLSFDQVSGYGRSGEAQRSQRIVYDARDKVLDATGESFTYSPLGPVVQSLTFGGGSEEFTVDALGNQYTHRADGLLQTYDYAPGSTKLNDVRVPAQSETGLYTDTTQYGYDIDGNRRGEATWHVLYNETPGFPPRCGRTATCLYTSRDYNYNAENLLERTYLKIDTTVTHQPYYPYTAEEHFRYDALGRRVWARMNHSNNCYLVSPRGGCVNTLTRSVWDGDQLLYETRVGSDSAGDPDAESQGGVDYGPVTYVNGGGLDSPLAIYKFGTLAVLPFENYRGVVDVVACPRLGNTGGCGDVPVPGIESGLYARDDANVTGRTGWFGTIQSGMKTGSGLVYQRNRYVDPETGKFTQADPIGLAGGLNAWGFAQGDPVNYADPFGLCPQCEALGIGYGGLAGAGVGIAITAGCAGVTGGICAAGAPLIVGASSGLGASVGGFIGKLADVFSRDGDPVGESGGERAGKPFTPGGKEAVRGSEGAPCAYCGTTTTRKPGPTQSQGEHVVPRADGGNGSPDNGVNACRTCNLDKGRRTPGQWEPRWYDPK